MFGLLPRNLEFFDCFEQAAQNAARTAELLTEFAAANGARRAELVGAIEENEHKGDHITHETLNRLEQTYLTPIDREDIHALITELDDVVDYIEGAAQRAVIYQIQDITPGFQQMCQVLLKAVRATAEAVACLRNLKDRNRAGKGRRVDEVLISIHDAENEGDHVHHRLLAELFTCGFDPFQVIKWKELYEIVENAIDGCEDVANTIRGIVLKNA